MTKTFLVLFSLLFSMQSVGENLRTEEVAFVSHGAKLSGSIVFPAGDIHAAVVFIHGSGKQARNLILAERFAKTGSPRWSTTNAEPGSPAVNTRPTRTSAKRTSPCWRTMRLRAPNASPLTRVERSAAGFAGISQAGWIAPLAAERSDLAKFLVLWSGPVCKVSEEDIFSKYTIDTDGEIAPPYEQALQVANGKVHLARLSRQGHRSK